MSEPRVVTNANGNVMTITSILPERETRKKNVAAYARVSTLNEEQEESFESQVAYYTAYIGNNPDWHFVKVYADNGKSGLSALKRPGFMQMIADAEAGGIDLILTRSISRFARNSLEAQTYVLQLKEKNVEVQFEKEGVSSFNPQSDMIFNFMTAIAQEESRSISENVRWTNRRLAEQGIRHIGSNHVLGYDEKKGKLVPNEDAWIVKLLFEEYAAGFTLGQIAKHINEKGGRRQIKKDEFRGKDLARMLDNEIYTGDRIIQKKAPINYLTKKSDPNEEYDYFYVEADHEPIVSRELFNAAKQRKENFKKESETIGWGKRNASPMYGKIICGECGEPMLRRTFNTAGGSVKVWKCRGRQNKSGCLNDIVREDDLFEWIGQEIELEGEVTTEMLSNVEKVTVYRNGKLEVVMKQEAGESRG